MTQLQQCDVLLQVVFPRFGEDYGENGQGPVFPLEMAHAVVVQLAGLLVTHMPKLVLGKGQSIGTGNSPHLVSDNVPSLDPEDTLILDNPGGVGHLSNHLHAELKEGRGEVGLHVELLQADRVGHQLPPIIVGLALKKNLFKTRKGEEQPGGMGSVRIASHRGR